MTAIQLLQAQLHCSMTSLFQAVCCDNDNLYLFSLPVPKEVMYTIQMNPFLSFTFSFPFQANVASVASLIGISIKILGSKRCCYLQFYCEITCSQLV